MSILSRLTLLHLSSTVTAYKLKEEKTIIIIKISVYRENHRNLFLYNPYSIHLHILTWKKTDFLYTDYILNRFSLYLLQVVTQSTYLTKGCCWLQVVTQSTHLTKGYYPQLILNPHCFEIRLQISWITSACHYTRHRLPGTKILERHAGQQYQSIKKSPKEKKNETDFKINKKS